jgi:hypothetical protein
MIRIWSTPTARAIDYGQDFERGLGSDLDQDETGYQSAPILEDDLDLD